MEKKSNNTIAKDALILFAITLIAGLLLGLVYDVTKDPIEKQGMAAKMDAFRVVMADADDFLYDDDWTALVEGSAEFLAESGQSFGNTTVDEVVVAVDASQNPIGYIVTATSKDGYGGDIILTVGVLADGTVSGIELLEINETVGFGMGATEPSYKDQYQGKNVDAFTVVKSGSTSDDQIDSVSGATITSEAVTNAVNTAMYFVKENLNR